jgi:hypothetical protein
LNSGIAVKRHGIHDPAHQVDAAQDADLGVQRHRVPRHLPGRFIEI